MSPTHLDLFSGIGGFALAAKWAGFETIGFAETDSFCDKVLKKNFPDVKNYGDVKAIDSPPHVDLMTGGFPCQPFSQAGSKKGIKDERYLWPEFRRIISQCRPDWVVIENVCGIIPVALDDILSDLVANDYTSEVFIIPACAANAPHRRERLWIVANSYSLGINIGFSDRKRRHLQENKDWNMAEIQSKWSQLKPDPWATHTARDWLDLNSMLSGNADGLPSRMDGARIKALGNAIVPQVIYPILEYIRQTYN